MAKLFFTLVNINDHSLLRQEREYHGKDLSNFIRTLQDANSDVIDDDGFRFVWRLDYGLCEYHKQQLDQAKLNSGEVYYVRYGRDCDGVEYAEAIKYNNELEAEQQQQDDYMWADGPMNFGKCSKEEYENFRPYSRDLFAEQAGY